MFIARKIRFLSAQRKKSAIFRNIWRDVRRRTTDDGRQGGTPDDRRRTSGRQGNAFDAVNRKSTRNVFFKWQMEKAALYLRISHIKTGKFHDEKAD
jgi:hypothetical protein